MFSSSFTMSKQKHRHWTPYKLAETKPDVACLQKLKVPDDNFAKRLFARRGRFLRDFMERRAISRLAGGAKWIGTSENPQSITWYFNWRPVSGIGAGQRNSRERILPEGFEICAEVLASNPKVADLDRNTERIASAIRGPPDDLSRTVPERRSNQMLPSQEPSTRVSEVQIQFAPPSRSHSSGILPRHRENERTRASFL